MLKQKTTLNKLTAGLTALLLLTTVAQANKGKKNKKKKNKTPHQAMPFEVPAEMKSEWSKLTNSEVKKLARQRFNDNKYGMFIHWGLYSQLGGMYKGRPMQNGILAEWIMRNEQIPRKEYSRLAQSFNPTKFNADEWVAIAKAAGMKYMVITAKHHDGFALFDTQVSDFSSVKATPFKRDIIKELEQACKKAGIDFGVYYSHSIDWADGGDGGWKDYAPKGARKRKVINTYDPGPIKFDDYIKNKSLPQVRELLANYDLTEIWFDLPIYMPPQQSLDFYKTVYNANPKTLINQRIGNGMGDFDTPGDNVIPKDVPKMAWEGIATTNNSWGYKITDKDWKSDKELLFWLLETMSKGGNFLLNVGPDGSGLIPEGSVTSLKAVGKWMEVNGEAVYGTKAWKVTHEGPTKIAMEGTHARKESTVKSFATDKDFWFTSKDNLVYISTIVRPKGNKISIKALKGLNIQEISLLNESGEVQWQELGDAIEITLPQLKNTTPGYALKVTLNK